MPNGRLGVLGGATVAASISTEDKGFLCPALRYHAKSGSTTYTLERPPYRSDVHVGDVVVVQDNVGDMAVAMSAQGSARIARVLIKYHYSI